MKKHILSRSSSRRTVILQLSLIIGVAISAIALQSYAANSPAFVQPSVAPPGGNAFAPLNAGNKVQTKQGGLVLNAGANSPALIGLIVLSGVVGIGKTPDVQGPTLQVDDNGIGAIYTNGKIFANQFVDSEWSRFYLDPARDSNVNTIVSSNLTTATLNLRKGGFIEFGDGSKQTTAAAALPNGSMIYANLGEDSYSPFSQSNSSGDSCDGKIYANYICPVNVSKTCRDLNGDQMRSVTCKAAQFYGVIR